MKHSVFCIILTFAVLTLASAQNPAPANSSAPATIEATGRPTYRLLFAITETESGKSLNSRNYVVLVQRGAERDSAPEALLRASARVPLPIGSYHSGVSAENVPANMQFQYIDSGVTISCRLWGTESNLFLGSDIEASGFMSTGDTGGVRQPTVRAYHNKTLAEIANGKPMVIATLEDVDAPRSWEVSVTATKLK